MKPNVMGRLMLPWKSFPNWFNDRKLNQEVFPLTIKEATLSQCKQSAIYDHKHTSLEQLLRDKKLSFTKGQLW